MAKQGRQGNSEGNPRQGRRGSGRREAFWGELTTWLDDWLAINPDGR